MRGESKKGMTLVELLVALVILAAIATSVAVSTSGMTERANVERAVREAEGLRDALTRRDGLNLASDMGMNPNDFTPGMLGLAATRTFRINEQREAEGTLDADNPGDMRHAPIYREYALIDLKNSVTNHAAEIAVLNNLLSERQSVSNEWAGVKIGAGWRGPYCAAVRQDEETRLVRDPFGGWWDAKRLDDGSGSFGVVSYGGDCLPMTDVNAQTNDWRAADIVIPVCATNSAVSLEVELALPENTTGNIRLYCISPRLDTVGADSDFVCAMRGRLAYFELAASGETLTSVVSGELGTGVWAIFACVTGGANPIVSRISTMHLYTGTNRVRMNLREVTN